MAMNGEEFEGLVTRRFSAPGRLYPLKPSLGSRLGQISTAGAILIHVGEISVPGGQDGWGQNIFYGSDFLVIVPETSTGKPGIAWADAKLSLADASYLQISRLTFLRLWPIKGYWRLVAERIVSKRPELVNLANLLGEGENPDISFVLMKGFFICPDTERNRRYLESEQNRERTHPLSADEVLFLQ